MTTKRKSIPSNIIPKTYKRADIRDTVNLIPLRNSIEQLLLFYQILEQTSLVANHIKIHHSHLDYRLLSTFEETCYQYQVELGNALKKLLFEVRLTGLRLQV